MNVLNLEECELLTDSKYRAYVSQVERALKAFEYTSEWADLISALGKLNKVQNLFFHKVLDLFHWHTLVANLRILYITEDTSGISRLCKRS